MVFLAHLLAPGLKYVDLFYCVICVSEPLLGELQAKQEEKLLFTADSHQKTEGRIMWTVGLYSLAGFSNWK